MAVAPPRPKGPPLNALRAFEAASRLGGIAQAAEELCVTPGAVSQHIKALEAWAGVALFERRSQGVRLTAAGAELAPGFTAAFDQLGEAVGRLRAARGIRSINVAAMPSVALLWLSPRLAGLRAAIAPAEVAVFALEAPPGMTREPFDLSLFMRPEDDCPTGIPLSDGHMFPVCAPAMAADLHGPEDVRQMTLLHDQTWATDWQDWARACGVTLPTGRRGLSYSLYSLALSEAKAGAGILVGHDCLVEDALAAGELVAPFGARVSSGRKLMLETSMTLQRSGQVQAIVGALSGEDQSR